MTTAVLYPLEVTPPGIAVWRRGNHAQDYVHSPDDDCILIMPADQPPRGTTAVRLGRVCV
ncbi:hypothetical protein HBA54_13335 [Pelagibius litoralis]|uniref:Uncharacterized protein n=1 Tax=Pelagibius litoralis TaxID=374515 RepID=A0A967EY89_9PROT|nr:hypothetical protein [Pelagibius litoralis]NIA69579.1 hypothetical protein [Pelagibius litoralis]